MDCMWPAGLLCPWDSPGKNTGVHCPSLLQGIFSTQGSNLRLLHCRQILYHLSHREAHKESIKYKFFSKEDQKSFFKEEKSG